MSTYLHNEPKSYWNDRFKRQVVKLLPGQLCVCKGNEMIVTVLGSCIAVCLYETELKIGGMNHFMLPKLELPPLQKNTMTTHDSAECNISHLYQGLNAARYGNVAVDSLINEIIKLGGARKNLTAKVFGGSSVTCSTIDIGRQNINFVNEKLAVEGIPNINQDVGGIYTRKVYFIPLINEVYVKTIKNDRNNTVNT